VYLHCDGGHLTNTHLSVYVSSHNSELDAHLKIPRQCRQPMPKLEEKQVQGCSKHGVVVTNNR